MEVTHFYFINYIGLNDRLGILKSLLIKLIFVLKIIFVLCLFSSLSFAPLLLIGSLRIPHNVCFLYSFLTQLSLAPPSPYTPNFVSLFYNKQANKQNPNPLSPICATYRLFWGY